MTPFGHTPALRRIRRTVGHVLTATPASSTSEAPEYDCIIIGAGFSGLYLVKLLREQGFKIKCFERGSGVGGTWYWNAYPGARVDVESMQYCYGWDRELQQEWRWTEKYSPQPELLKYLNHVADRHSLRSEIQFDTEVTKMIFDEGANLWIAETSKGDLVRTRFCVCATGALSQRQEGSKLFPGFSDFLGDVYHTSAWREGNHVGDRRVAVIGTGSSGIQSIPEIAKTAKHLTVFQRTATWTTPAWNAPLDREKEKAWKADYVARREAQTQHANGFYLVDWPVETRDNMLKNLKDVSEKDRNEHLEKMWTEHGGLMLMSAYADLTTNFESSNFVADFVRKKIRETVKDPQTAEMLCPKIHYGCKRLCVDTNYWATFNRPNVSLVDISEATGTPIRRFTKKGLQTSDGKEHAVDCIVFATGFDALTGAITNIDITGQEGMKLKEEWKDGPRTFMGLAISGFPNLFTVTGPASPSVYTNMLVSIELHVEWIADTLVHMRSKGLQRIVADNGAEKNWMDHTEAVFKAAPVKSSPTCMSWYTGDNINGKKRANLVYAGGHDVYARKLAKATNNGYRGFILS